MIEVADRSNSDISNRVMKIGDCSNGDRSIRVMKIGDCSNGDRSNRVMKIADRSSDEHRNDCVTMDYVMYISPSTIIPFVQDDGKLICSVLLFDKMIRKRIL